MTSDHGQPAQSFASIGIDIGKDVFHIVGFDADGRLPRSARWNKEMNERSAPGAATRWAP